MPPFPYFPQPVVVSQPPARWRVLGRLKTLAVTTNRFYLPTQRLSYQRALVIHAPYLPNRRYYHNL
jgi:hypothetical protein